MNKFATILFILTISTPSLYASHANKPPCLQCALDDHELLADYRLLTAVSPEQPRYNLLKLWNLQETAARNAVQQQSPEDTLEAAQVNADIQSCLPAIQQALKEENRLKELQRNKEQEQNSLQLGEKKTPNYKNARKQALPTNITHIPFKK